MNGAAQVERLIAYGRATGDAMRGFIAAFDSPAALAKAAAAMYHGTAVTFGYPWNPPNDTLRLDGLSLRVAPGGILIGLDLVTAAELAFGRLLRAEDFVHLGECAPDAYLQALGLQHDDGAPTYLCLRAVWARGLLSLLDIANRGDAQPDGWTSALAIVYDRSLQILPPRLGIDNDR